MIFTAIERAVIEDGAALQVVLHNAYRANRLLGFPASAERVSIAEIEEWIQTCIVWKAIKNQGNKIVGTIRMKPDYQSGVMAISRFAVLPEEKGSGVGSLLLYHAEEYARETRFEKIQLTCAIGHPFLADMYQRKGYRIIDELILADLPYNEYVMERDLTANLKHV